jgi:hypothetical protein
MMAKFLWLLATVVQCCSAFISPKCSTKALSMPKMCITKMKPNDSNSDSDYKNKSKIIKLDFSEDMEEPEQKLFKPRYAFGLSEFDLILLKVYVNLVIMIYICNIVLGLY